MTIATTAARQLCALATTTLLLGLSMPAAAGILTRIDEGHRRSPRSGAG